MENPTKATGKAGPVGHKPALPWPAATDPATVRVEVPSVLNRAPDARELAEALRRIARLEVTAADASIRASNIGELITVLD